MSMTCAEFESLLCDYIDGTVDDLGRAAVEAHQRECTACAELARDAMGAVAFMSRVAEPEPPAELLTRIAFEIPSAPSERRPWWRSLFGPVMQPKFAMGMAMTILSFSMLDRFAGIEVRQLRPSDLEPAKIWAALDDRTHRVWDRAVKYYESLRVVYEVQSRLKEWSEQEEEERKAAQPGAPAQSLEGQSQK